MEKGIKIFVIEDDKFYNSVVTNFLKLKGFIVNSFLSGEDAIAYNDTTPDIALVDYNLPGLNGIETMKTLLKKYPKAEFLLISGQTEIKVVIDSVHEGAFDYIVKDEHTKENAYYKIQQILRYRKVNREKNIYRKVVFYLIASVALVWGLTMAYYYLIKK